MFCPVCFWEMIKIYSWTENANSNIIIPISKIIRFDLYKSDKKLNKQRPKINYYFEKKKTFLEKNIL